MGNQQTLINHNSPFVFIKNLDDQLLEIQTKYHPAFGKIKIWRMTTPDSFQVFSFYVHSYQEDSAVQYIHALRSKLQHPNLLQYLACTYIQKQNVETQQYFFEYHPMTMKQIIRKKRVTELQIWKYLEQIVSVMSYLQEAGRVHGKLTSNSLLVTDNNQVKLLDSFGARPKKNSIKQDVYDCGLVIIEMMTQKSNLIDLVLATQLNLLATIKELIGTYTCQLLQLVAKMISKDQQQRPDFVQLKKLILDRFNTVIVYKQINIDNMNRRSSRADTTSQPSIPGVITSRRNSICPVIPCCNSSQPITTTGHRYSSSQLVQENQNIIPSTLSQQQRYMSPLPKNIYGGPAFSGQITEASPNIRVYSSPGNPYELSRYAYGQQLRSNGNQVMFVIPPKTLGQQQVYLHPLPKNIYGSPAYSGYETTASPNIRIQTSPGNLYELSRVASAQQLGNVNQIYTRPWQE